MEQHTNIKSKKFHVGKFELTQQNGVLIFTAKVEIDKHFVKPVFWMETYSFGNDKRSMSIALEAIELRTIAYQLKDMYSKEIDSFKKFSGGQSASKSMSVKIIDTYTDFSFKQNENIVNSFRFPTIWLRSLADQINHLVDTATEASYKTQQYRERKKQNG